MNNVEMYDFLMGKKADWYPDKIKVFIGKRGQITRKALNELAYYDLPLVGFNNSTKQREWMIILAAGLEEHHGFMENINKEIRERQIDADIKRLEYRRDLLNL